MEMTKQELYDSLVELQRKAREKQYVYEVLKSSMERELRLSKIASEEAEKQLTIVQNRLKDLILSDLIENGEKPDMVGVKITHTNKLNYDEQTAVVWAINNNIENVLTIKKSEMNKTLKDMQELPFFVTEERVPTVAISTDLVTEIAVAELKGKNKEEIFLPEGLRK